MTRIKKTLPPIRAIRVIRGQKNQYTSTAARSADFTTSSNFRSFVSGSCNFAATT